LKTHLLLVTCITCGRRYKLEYDLDSEEAAPLLAEQQLEEECPEHESLWSFWDQLRATGPGEWPEDH
jgi:hypothetical protein